MKIVSSKQMSHIESEAYRDGASESDFMEEAGSGIALVVHDFVEKEDLDPRIILLCGKGNNSGDAYVAGVHLLLLDYDVTAYQLVPIDECSPLCKQNYSRFSSQGGRIVDVYSEKKLTLPKRGVIVDGIFGTGFRGTAEEPFATAIRLANDSRLPIIAVDIPSGLNGDDGSAKGAVINAVKTIFLGLPKTGFFLRDGWDHVGKLHYIDFGLGQQYIDRSEYDLTLLSQDLVKPLMPTIKPSRHKYEAGYVIGLAGSPGMPGAAILSATAALRGGAGIVRLLHPEGMENELSASPYELIKVPYHPDAVETIAEVMNQATATFIGPGLGRDPSTSRLLSQLLPILTKPTVLDGDALTIIAEKNLNIPKGAVLTPHHGEFKRLMKLEKLGPFTLEFLKNCQEFVIKNEITLVLKGGPTFIFHPGEQIVVSAYGDPGMATAGSGDVLTGLIASLLAQGLVPYHAAALGTYLHGLAGEYAADELTSPCMIASDIIESFPSAFSDT